eukprot:g20560.t1
MESPAHALRFSVNQLAGGFTDIINLSLLQSEAPISFKKTIIIPVPKETYAECINDCNLAALTSIIMKCFERLVMPHINSSLLSCLDTLLQSVKIDNITSFTSILNTDALQGGPLLYSLYTLDCVTKFRPNSIYKFADNTIILGQVSNNDETEYRKETECLVSWCTDNNLSLNVSKTKELIIDFRKRGVGHGPIYIMELKWR